MSEPSLGLFRAFCDDAAVFPPGSLPLDVALRAHDRHQQGPHAPLVGSFVLAAADLPRLAQLVADGDPAPRGGLTLTTPLPRLEAALQEARALESVRLAGLEIALPDDVPASAVVPELERAAPLDDVAVVVEVPRDSRRGELIGSLSGTGFGAKLRTGGVRADLYPDEVELAEAVVSLTRAGVPFKATAGLHHALRNTDPETGFEQHGFLNLLLATAAALDGADAEQLAGVLRQRDGSRVVAAVQDVDPRAREWFRSFGTCSISEPVDELVGLGLLPASLHTGAVQGGVR